MCDPVSATIAAVGVGGAAYSDRQARRAQGEAQSYAEQQAQLEREAQAQLQADQIAFQRQQQAEQQALAQEQFEQQQRQQQAQMVMQTTMSASQMALQQQAIQRQEAEAERVRQAEIRRQQNIQEGQGLISETFSQFNDDFYGQRQQQYQEYATPQLQRQYRDAMNSLVRALSRSGNLNSSVRGQSMADLQRQYDEGLALIANNASGYANQARSAIETARANLLSQNSTLADPGVMRGLTESQVSTLRQAQPFTPLGSLISALSRNAGDAAGVNKRRETPQGIGLVSNSLATSTGNVVA